ncbi:protein transport protein Sec16B isoform X2 [Erpetoichthys calabaricus]|uniref:protein transport protein Sec16B isoform X2 n=1 Tax=Erpetoichthys calabaricus TaxID=27687 RepID=UPI0022347F29|nr:protein transport protein Sec16B isoform X2 [Erpetoichthys calabaricus]
MDPRDHLWHNQRSHAPSHYTGNPHYFGRPFSWDVYYNGSSLPMPEQPRDVYYTDADSRSRTWAQYDPRMIHYISSPIPRHNYGINTTRRPSSKTDHFTEMPETSTFSRQRANCYEAWELRSNRAGYDREYHRMPYAYGDAETWNYASQYQEYTDNNQETYEEVRYRQDKTHFSYMELEPLSINQHPVRDHAYDRIAEDNFGKQSEESADHSQLSFYGYGQLANCKISGLSSSSHELSQYMDSSYQYDAEPSVQSTSLQPDYGIKSESASSLKFCLPHVAISFGPGGQLVRVNPHRPSEGEPALVEIHSLEVILVSTREQEEMRLFPGPLLREDLHKVDVLAFCQHQIRVFPRGDTRRDDSCVAILWKMLELLCRQNGRIVGSDVAELLMKDCKNPRYYTKAETVDESGSLIDLSDEMTIPDNIQDGTDLLTGERKSSTESYSESLQRYTRLLLSGRKKEALEAAMGNELWGHAFFLASKMDSRTYINVLNRFTNSLALSDPLQTLFQLLSGRTPIASTNCGDDRWGDWKPHLAMMLSNQTSDPDVYQKAVITMADTLASKDFINAAHFCYLIAGVPFGNYTDKSEKMVLLGSNHNLPFLKFATTSAIQLTEVFEYCQRLGNPSFSISAFQVYKFLYACRLLDYGLASQAFHYCEVIGKTIVDQETCSPVLLQQIIMLSDRLKLSDPLFHERSELVQDLESDWLKRLRQMHVQSQVEAQNQCGNHQRETIASVSTDQEIRVQKDRHTVPNTQDHWPDGAYHHYDHWDPVEESAFKSLTHPVPTLYMSSMSSRITTEPSECVPSKEWVTEDQMESTHGKIKDTAGDGLPADSNESHVSQETDVLEGKTQIITKEENDPDASFRPLTNKVTGKMDLQANKEPRRGWFGWFRSAGKQKTEAAHKEVSGDTMAENKDISTSQLIGPPPPGPINQYSPPPPTQDGVNPYSRKARAIKPGAVMD